MYRLATASMRAMRADGTRSRHAPPPTAIATTNAIYRAPRMFDLPPGAASGVMRGKAEHWLYVVAGSGVVQRNGTPIALKRGTLVVIQRNERHEIVNDGDEVLRAISMNSAFAESAPQRRWFEGSRATVAAAVGFASLVVSLFYRLVG